MSKLILTEEQETIIDTIMKVPQVPLIQVKAVARS